MENDSDSFTYIDTESDGVSAQRLVIKSLKMYGFSPFNCPTVLPLKIVCIFNSDGRRTRTRTRSEAETLSSSNLMNALDGKDLVFVYVCYFFIATLYSSFCIYRLFVRVFRLYGGNVFVQDLGIDFTRNCI